MLKVQKQQIMIYHCISHIVMMRFAAIILIFLFSISKYASCYQRDPWSSNILSIEGVEIPLFHFEQKSYYVGEHKLSYSEAGQFCNSINMELVAVHSANEFEALWNYVKHTKTMRKFWTSGSILLNGHTWIWMSTLQLVSYTKWKPGEPNNRLTERCLEFISDDNVEFLFNDRDCNAKASFICQREIHAHPSEQNYTPESREDYPEDSNLPVTVVDDVQYRFSQYAATREQAAEACKDYGLALVSIQDKKKNDIIHDLISKNLRTDFENYFWTSGKRIIYGRWLWENFQPLVYTNWADYEPEIMSRTKLCLYLFPNGKLRDIECNAQLRFICEGPHVPKTRLITSGQRQYVELAPKPRPPREDVNCSSGEVDSYYDIVPR